MAKDDVLHGLEVITYDDIGKLFLIKKFDNEKEFYQDKPKREYLIRGTVEMARQEAEKVARTENCITLFMPTDEYLQSWAGDEVFDHINYADISYKANIKSVCVDMLRRKQEGKFYGTETVNGLKMAIAYIDSIEGDKLTERELNNATWLSDYRGAETDYTRLITT
ncbi:MAG: hypothetical protein OSJ54_11435 [Oscillospiraceae bacterium]|nr:hypothetical protein [Oscillospiraceae bacterium]